MQTGVCPSLIQAVEIEKMRLRACHSAMKVHAHLIQGGHIIERLPHCDQEAFVSVFVAGDHFLLVSSLESDDFD